MVCTALSLDTPAGGDRVRDQGQPPVRRTGYSNKSLVHNCFIVSNRASIEVFVFRGTSSSKCMFSSSAVDHWEAVERIPTFIAWSIIEGIIPTVFFVCVTIELSLAILFRSNRVFRSFCVSMTNAICSLKPAAFLVAIARFRLSNADIAWSMSARMRSNSLPMIAASHVTAFLIR